ncbi:hypothetical protein FNF27_02679 [Cafeteria roenbergensis]|uniref:STI1 domain-containing protein n=1 Tax=Cafeteria roenbergensis TaxID=33653 RepID=A0A5A8EFB8_CAFRO|nr:hypothetical protein FNF27_02679 [Cafeteria roenbergensis]
MAARKPGATKPVRLDDLLGADAVASSEAGSAAPAAVAKLLGHVQADADDASDAESDGGSVDSEEDDGPSMYEQMMAQGISAKKQEAEKRRLEAKAASKQAFGAEPAKPAAGPAPGKKARGGLFSAGFLNRKPAARRAAPGASAAKAGQGSAAPPASPAAAPAAAAAAGASGQGAAGSKPRPAAGAGASEARETLPVLEPLPGGGFDLTKELSVPAGAGSSSGRASQRSGAVLPEVQAAMAAGAGAADRLKRDTSWANEELMRRVASDPVLAMGMANPRCQAAIADLQKDPATAKRKYASDPLVRTFLERFVAVMGEHFTKLGAEEDKGKAAEAARKKAAEAEASAAAPIDAEELARMARDKELAADDDDVRRALSDPAVVRAMQDPMVQHCLQVCRTEPHRLPEFTKSARVRNHLMVLKRAGVIQLE